MKPQASPISTSDSRLAQRMCYSPYLDRGRLRGKAAIEQMAGDFRQFAAVAGSVNQDELELLGWSATQIALHAPDARRYANRLADVSRGQV
ncbi:MAG: hypothetical protein PS018_17285 [bacterium]|nr:hypothetical protein [bacterium]